MRKQNAKGLSKGARRPPRRPSPKSTADHQRTTVHVPDIQMEYDMREHELERAKLELVSEENDRRRGFEASPTRVSRLCACGDNCAGAPGAPRLDIRGMRKS